MSELDPVPSPRHESAQPETEPSATIKPNRTKRPLTEERKEQLKAARAKALEVRRERADIKKAERNAMKVQWEARRKMTEKKLMALKKEEDEEPQYEDDDQWDEEETSAPPPREVARPAANPASRSGNHPDLKREGQQFIRSQAGQGWADPEQQGASLGPQRTPQLERRREVPQQAHVQPPPMEPSYGSHMRPQADEWTHAQQPHPSHSYSNYNYQPRRVGHPPTAAAHQRAYNREPVPLDRQPQDYSLADLEEMTARDAYGDRVNKLKQEMAYKSIFR